MRILIVEDEAPAARRLEKLVKAFSPDTEFVGILETVEATVEALRNGLPVDLILMDIHLADGSSFDIFARVEVKTPVIFTTAYSDYMLKAFRVNSIDYLLKPIDPDDLGRALRKFENLKEQFGQTTSQVDFTALAEQLQLTLTNYKSRFLVRIGERFAYVNTDDIAYFYTEDKVVFVRTINNKRYPVDKSLEDVMTALDPERFFRLNRQIITAIDAIDEIHTHFNGKLLVKLQPETDEQVFVSRDKVPAFKDWLDH